MAPHSRTDPHLHARFIDFCARAGREAREDRGLPAFLKQAAALMDQDDWVFVS